MTCGARGPPTGSATEALNAPSYEAAMRERCSTAALALIFGRGAGVFLRMAADRGAAVSGLDVSEGLLAEAARRVPEADLDGESTGCRSRTTRSTS